MVEPCIVSRHVPTLEFLCHAPLVLMSSIFGFFGLRENPFKINPDPRFLFTTDQTRAISDELVYAIRSRKGLILLTGEVGTGKTMLIRRLLDWLTEQNMPTALIFNSHIQPEHLLDFILNDFGVPCASTLKSEKLMALNRWLLGRYRASQIPVLIVDEAQGLEPAALEEIRLLLNFETPREKLLQIVLAGQPELQNKLKRHELRQLRQRITVRCTTAPLTLDQTYGYIRERLRIAGANGTPIFEPDAIGAIHAYSLGVPRVINLLAEHSLINACAEGASIVSADAVEQAAHDCQLDRADSVARMLHTGSYSTSTLSDIGTLLASISANSDCAPEAAHISQSPEAPPPSSRAVFYSAQPPLTPERVSRPIIADSRMESDETGNGSGAVEAHNAQEAPPMAPALPVPREVAAATRAQSDEFAVKSSPSLLHLTRLWSQSFLTDLRASFSQVRRTIRSFEAQRWHPLIRNLRRQLHQLRIRASGLASNPRWKEIRTQATSGLQTLRTSFRSAMPPWLTDHFGIPQPESRKRAQPSTASPVKRRRAIFSLRRWLHAPLTNQPKRTGGNQRRSVG
jgi:general secretion pathway protein A